MLSDRLTRPTRRTALLGLMVLAGCGFSPVYGTDGVAAHLRGTVQFITPATVTGFRMRQRFEDKLGLTQQPRFVLSSSMKQVATPAAMSVGGDTSRFNLVGTSDWSLARLDGTVLGHGSVESFTSYSSSGSTVATQSTADDAANRLAVTLADLILARVILIQTETPQ